MNPPNRTLNLSSAGDALMLKVKREAERQGIPLEAAIMHASVAHDDWCAFLNNRGECNCEPDIKFPVPGR